MSYTEVYKFTNKGNCRPVGEIQNAFRGAMAVWTILEDRYLPPYYMYGVQKATRMLSFGGNNLQQQVWDLADDTRLKPCERIVMKSTFDRVIVIRENIPKVIAAFREFEGDTNLKQQATLIEVSLNDNNLSAICWNQTSVNCNPWEKYNILKKKDHWELFESLHESV